MSSAIIAALAELVRASWEPTDQERGDQWRELVWRAKTEHTALVADLAATKAQYDALKESCIICGVPFGAYGSEPDKPTACILCTEASTKVHALWDELCQAIAERDVATRDLEAGCGTHSCNECIRWREKMEAELDKADRRSAEAERVLKDGR